MRIPIKQPLLLPLLGVSLLALCALGTIAVQRLAPPPSRSLGQTITFEAIIPLGESAMPPMLKRTQEQDVLLRVAPFDAIKVRNALQNKRLVRLQVTVR